MSKLNLPVPAIKSISVDGQSVNIMEFLTRDFEDIREASEKLPGMLTFLGHARARALADTMMAKRMLAQTKATIYFELREGGFETRGFGGKPTEEALKHAIVLDEKVIAAAEYQEQTVRFFSVLDSTVDGMLAKLDLVRSSEATKRIIETPDEKSIGDNE